ncbi:hypothetical protein [Subtercola vilae]|uniref:Uncharacterized protein n=1 Tax=Subtercola vilae TaxID=2056433 RepID=A0A4T2BPP4_9MICO|nr:hypothetical protein [Subtercola vilae]TIH33673.1 hypothetical protein D4765_14415 [Subtercola vilae]
MDDITQILQLLSKKSLVTVFAGTLVSIDSSGCYVDCGGGRTPARTVGSYLPEINEPVWVFYVDGQPYVFGSAVPKPGQGQVVSVAANLVTLSTSFGNVTVPFMRGITPTVGDMWKLLWQGGGFAVAPMSTSPLPPVAPPAPGGGVSNHVDTFRARGDSGSYSSSYGGWNQAQIISADHWQGLWTFGSSVSDTVPASAAISLVELYISVQTVNVTANSNISLHAYQTRPGGAPSYGASVSLPLTPGWLVLPNSFGDSLKSGGGFAGVGLNHGGQTYLSSITQDGQSGALRITSSY